ncbi:hypothetical protein GFI10_22945 [Salmonella enterica subsp. diarizonae]|nr:hypothetical protein [Salmonella enterica subsp. diarizonae]
MKGIDSRGRILHPLTLNPGVVKSVRDECKDNVQQWSRNHPILSFLAKIFGISLTNRLLRDRLENIAPTERYMINNLKLIADGDSNPPLPITIDSNLCFTDDIEVSVFNVNLNRKGEKPVPAMYVKASNETYILINPLGYPENIPSAVQIITQPDCEWEAIHKASLNMLTHSSYLTKNKDNHAYDLRYWTD